MKTARDFYSLALLIIFMAVAILVLQSSNVFGPSSLQICINPVCWGISIFLFVALLLAIIGRVKQDREQRS